MLTTFWQGVGGRLADRWAATSVPALIFWLGGLAAWTCHRGGLHTLDSQARWLDRQTAAVQVTVIVTVLLAVAASAILVDQMTAPLLRLLEGYWPPWAGPLHRRLTEQAAARAAAETEAWQRAYDAVTVQPPAVPTAEQLARYADLERRRRRYPAAPGYFLPTPIGNILRAAERRPADKYGLDTITIWPHLWLLLPEATRKELRTARTSLDTAVAAATWGLLSCAFTPFTPLAIPIGLAVTTMTVTVVIPARALAFGDLIEAACDLHRTSLYQQLRWPLPPNPHEEHASGRQLTAYLRRGSDTTTPTFTPPA